MSSKLRKAELLLKEAKADLEHGSFNKAVSASYFAVRLTVEHFLPDIRTTKDDKLANALFREIKRRKGEEKAKEVKKCFLFLFNERKKADHRPYIFSGEEAFGIVARAESLIEELLEIFGAPRPPSTNHPTT